MNKSKSPSKPNKLVIIDYIQEIARDMAKSLKKNDRTKITNSIIRKTKDNKMKNSFKIAKNNKMPNNDKKIIEIQNDITSIKNPNEEKKKISNSPKINSKSKVKVISKGNDLTHKKVDKFISEKQKTKENFKKNSVDKDQLNPNNPKVNKKFEKWVNIQISKKKEELRLILEKKDRDEKTMVKLINKPKINKTFDSTTPSRNDKLNNESLTKRSVGKDSIHEKLYKNTEENQRVAIKNFKLMDKLTPSFNPSINTKLPNFKNRSLNSSKVTSKNISKVHSKIITDLTTQSRDNSISHTQRSINNSARGEKIINTMEGDSNSYIIGIYKDCLNQNQGKFQEFNKNKLKILKAKREVILNKNKKIKILSQNTFSNFSKSFIGKGNDFTVEKADLSNSENNKQSPNLFKVKNNVPGEGIRSKIHEIMKEEEEDTENNVKDEFITNNNEYPIKTDINNNIERYKRKSNNINIKKHLKFNPQIFDDKKPKTRNSTSMNIEESQKNN